MYVYGCSSRAKKEKGKKKKHASTSHKTYGKREVEERTIVKEEKKRGRNRLNDLKQRETAEINKKRVKVKH